MKVELCSACLLGVSCRYDGKSKSNDKILELAKSEVLIPVCPEQLGGLPTPRVASEQRSGRVVSKEGVDVTCEFQRGAGEVLRIAKIFGVKRAILKQRSPSCGSGQIYDGAFAGKIIEGDGVTTSLLKKNGIEVISEDKI